MAVAQMDEVTQQNAALVEQTAAAAESLEEQADALSLTIKQFRLDSNHRLVSPVIIPYHYHLSQRIEATPQDQQDAITETDQSRRVERILAERGCNFVDQNDFYV